MEINKLRSNVALINLDFDPNSASPVDAGWVDMRDFGSILAGFTRTVGTSAVTMALLANDKADGSGTDVTVKTKTITAQPDAVGDQIWLESDAAEIRQACDAAGVDGRYVSLSISVATLTDEGMVTYLRGNARHAAADLTADVIA